MRKKCVCMCVRFTTLIIGQMIIAHIEQDVRRVIWIFPIDFCLEIFFWNDINHFIVATVPKIVGQFGIFFGVYSLEFQLAAIVAFALVFFTFLLLLLVIVERPCVCRVMTGSQCHTQMHNNTIQTVFVIDAFVAVLILHARRAKAVQFHWCGCDRMNFIHSIVKPAQYTNQNPRQLWIWFQLNRFLTMLALFALNFLQILPG